MTSEEIRGFLSGAVHGATPCRSPGFCWAPVQALHENGRLVCLGCLAEHAFFKGQSDGFDSGEDWAVEMLTKAPAKEAADFGYERHYPLRAVRGAFVAGQRAALDSLHGSR